MLTGCLQDAHFDFKEIWELFESNQAYTKCCLSAAGQTLSKSPIVILVRSTLAQSDDFKAIVRFLRILRRRINFLHLVLKLSRDAVAINAPELAPLCPSFNITGFPWTANEIAPRSRVTNHHHHLKIDRSLARGPCEQHVEVVLGGRCFFSTFASSQSWPTRFVIP